MVHGDSADKKTSRNDLCPEDISLTYKNRVRKEYILFAKNSLHSLCSLVTTPRVRVCTGVCNASPRAAEAAVRAKRPTGEENENAPNNGVTEAKM